MKQSKKITVQARKKMYVLKLTQEARTVTNFINETIKYDRLEYA